MEQQGTALQHAARNPESVSLLRLPKVIARTGCGRTKIYDMVARGEFPAPVKLPGRAVAWPSNVVDQWIQDVIRAGRVEGGAA